MSILITAGLVFVTNLALVQAAQPAQQDETARAHVLIAAMAVNDFGTLEAQFDDKMKAALPPERLATMWQRLVTQVGAYKSCAPQSRVRNIADKQMVITTCEFERAPVDLQFAFDLQGRISGLAMRPARPATIPYTLPSYATPTSYTEETLTIGSARGGEGCHAADADPAGRARLSGDDGRVRQVGRRRSRASRTSRSIATRPSITCSSPARARACPLNTTCPATWTKRSSKKSPGGSRALQAASSRPAARPPLVART